MPFRFGAQPLLRFGSKTYGIVPMTLSTMSIFDRYPDCEPVTVVEGTVGIDDVAHLRGTVPVGWNIEWEPGIVRPRAIIGGDVPAGT